MSETAAPKTQALKTQRPANSPRFVLYTAAISAVMMICLFFVLGIWPFGGGTILTGDLNSQYINFYSYYKNAVLGDGSLIYSFSKGLGGGLIGILAYYITSPFNLLYLITPLEFFPVTASIIWLLKIVLACCFAQIWLGRRYPALSWWSVALALCYGFMAYNFAYAQNIMWLDGMMLLPLLCLGVDGIAAGKPFTLYAITLAVAIFSNFYIAYMLCIYMVLYFIYTMLTRKKQLAKEVGWKTPLIRFGLGSLLAGGVNAAILAPSVMAVGQSKGGLLAYKFSFEPLFALRRLPERLVFASFATTDMEGGLPFIYCGALVMVFALTYFISKAIPFKHKLLSAGMLAVFALSFWIKGLDTIWHGFKEPVWFPARYSFIFSSFLVLLAATAFSRQKRLIHDIPVAGGAVMLLLFFMAAFPVGVSRSRILLTILIIAFVTIGCTMWLRRASLRRLFLQAVILTVVAAELVAGGFYMQARFEKYPLDVFRKTVQSEGGTVNAIHKYDENPGGYRIAENGYRSLNDAMLLNYSGIGHFSSVQDGYAQSLLYNLGYRVYGGTGPYINGNTAFADSVLGIKYLYDNGGRAVPSHWREIGISSPLPVYKNQNALPTAFAVNLPPEGTTLAHEPATPGEMFTYQNKFYNALGGEGDLFTTPSKIVLRAAGGETLSLYASVPPGAAYEITASQNGRHYAYFGADGFPMLDMWVNGRQTEPYFTTLNNAVVDLGWLNAGQTATVHWGNTDSLSIEVLSVACMDEKKLYELSRTAAANSGEYALKDGFLEGSFTGGENSFLYTSIPFDEGWSATVNGQSVETEAFMDALLSVPLAQGENIVQLKYSVPGTGALWRWVSVISAVLLAALIVMQSMPRRQNSAHPAQKQAQNTAENPNTKE